MYHPLFIFTSSFSYPCDDRHFPPSSFSCPVTCERTCDSMKTYEETCDLRMTYGWMRTCVETYDVTCVMTYVVTCVGIGGERKTCG